MRLLDDKKQINQIQDHHVNQRKFYAKFVEKMLSLKYEIDRGISSNTFKTLAT
jgi:hypothetical protein